MRKTKETHTFDFRPLGLAIREARVDEYFYPAEKVTKSTARRQIETSLDLLRDNELKIIQGTIDGILNSRESKK